MSSPRARQSAGAPSFCWHCNKPLQRAPGKGLGLFYYHLVQGPDGHRHRVHGGECLRQATTEGNEYVKPGEEL